ncbi:MAG: short-chain dehydrogenase [Alphaproteobacteria bacterium]|nr:MAG: short-chain dehydrogenase [Alphaproteobacteria bacterium]
MSNILENKSILVTGSSSGIGYAIAKQALAAGANVMLHGSNADKLKEAASSLGDKTQWVVADLSDSDAPEIMMQACIDAFGDIDGLVNNAGIFPRSTIDTSEDDDFDRIFHINTRAPLMLCKYFVANCRERSTAGSIVNIGSINAWCGGNDLLIYSMSKGALMTMTRNLGDALSEENIRVNQLNVGWTLTDGEKAMQKSLGAPDNWHENIPLAAAPRGQLLQPHEIANHVVFWLSDLSAPVTGSVYEIEQYPVIGRNKIAG